MELTGKVIAVLPERSGTSAKGEWKSQDYVLEYVNGKYTNKMLFSVFGEDKLQQFNIQVNDTYKVAFDIDAHEWQGRWFTDIRAWAVTRVTAQAAQPNTAAGQAQAQPESQQNVASQPTQSQTVAQPNEATPKADPFAEGAEADNLPF